MVVARTDPRFSSAVVGLQDARGGRRGPAAVLVLQRNGGDALPAGRIRAWIVDGPATTFPGDCSAATPKGVRALACPDPWRVLDYPRPGIRAQTVLAQRIPSANLHAIDWSKVALPGGVCGSSRPIRPHDHYIRADVDLPWWNPVVVSWSATPVYGDLDGDGRDEAALNGNCANGGGTASGQLAFFGVVFKAVGRSLRVVGIVTPRQPLTLDMTHVALGSVRSMGGGEVVVSEYRYGPYDGTCCPSGRAATTWIYSHGRLRQPRSEIRRRPWASSLEAYVLIQPGERWFVDQGRTRIPASSRLRFDVMVSDTLGDRALANVKVTLTIRSSSPTITRTRTIARIGPQSLDETRLSFGGLGRLPAGRGTVTVDIHAPGTFPQRYPVVFTRG
jgi:hypothetical protein